MQNISQVPTPSGCCGKTHAKIFEILLIVGFSASVAILVVNLVLTMFIFKYSDIIFFSEIGIAALNFICIIFSIILRVWRSNGSVLDLHYSSSNAISIIILVIIILNLICSLGEDVLYYFTVPLLTMDDDDPEPSEKIEEIFEKIFNKDLDYSAYRDLQKKKIIFKILPYASASFSALVQIISMIFIILIRKRIKYKSDFGIVSNIIQTQALQQSSQNKMSGNNTNLGLGSNNKTNNIYEGNAKDVKTKKSKKKKKSKDEDNGMVVPDSAQIEIMTKKKKKAKKGKKKKNKSKDKKGKMN